MRIRTLRTRIALWYGAIIAVCLVGYSVAVAASFAWHVQQELDHRVHEDIELAARAISIDEQGRPYWPRGFEKKDIEEEEGGGHAFEVWSYGGERLLSAGTFAPGFPEVPQGEEPPRTVELSGRRVRMKTEAIRVGAQTFLVRAMVSEDPSRRQIRSIWTELALISATVLVLGGFGGIALAHMFLGPLARMADHARRITAEDLHERLQSDVSGLELEQIRDAFNTTLARLESSFAQLRRFTADASHEIRTPLTALRSVGEVALRTEKSGDEYREVIGTMLEEVDRLSRLSDELLTIARAEAGQVTYSFEALDLGRVATEVADQLSVLAEERQESLVLDAAGPVIVLGDRLSLRQALMNLIDNAIKYSPEGSPVNVAVRRDEKMGIVEVRDQGSGIPPEHHDRIFERFYRIDPGRSREMGGTGLGLSLVKLTADAHSGRVELESTVGQGSTFRIYIPLAKQS